MKKGNGIIRDPQQKKLRALLMLEHKVKYTASSQEIATEFNVSIDTVKRTLSWARKAQLSVEVEDRILEELMPLAHEAIKLALGDTEAAPIERAKIALELYKGMVPGFGKKATAASDSAAGVETIADYINQFRTGLGVIDAGTTDVVGHALHGGQQLQLTAGTDPSGEVAVDSKPAHGPQPPAEALLAQEILDAPPGHDPDGASSPAKRPKAVGKRVRKRASVSSE
jgi:hypothetical protein